MKNKIISLLVLLSFLFPLISSAAVVPPFVYITVIVNTEQDANFPYNISGAGQSFNIQTQNLQGSKSTYFYINWGTIYNLSQDIVPGLNIDSILCASTNPTTTFSYYPNGVVFNPVGYEDIICNFNNIKVSTRNPILIVPGLAGTEIKRGGELLWLDIDKIASSITDDFMDPLSFGLDLQPRDSLVYRDEIIKKKTTIIGNNEVTLFDYTDGLINEFIGQGYVENETLFTFPYDWRYGVSGVYADGLPAQAGATNVDLLKQKIDDILQQTGADKVDVVAHSLGGLIVKKYAMDNPTDNHIGKAVFVGVPNTGTPKAVKVLLQGDNLGVNFGVLGLNDAEIKKIAENMPVSYDLLPSQEYYADNGAFVKTVNVDVGNLIYEENDLDYQETKTFITEEHNFNLQGMTNAENLRSNAFDNFDPRTAGIDLYSINGCKSGTIDKITETTKTDFYGYTNTIYDIHKIGAGDGTVPLSSAENLLVDDANVFYAKYADHGKMPSQSGIRQQIVNIVSGTSLNTGNNIITKSQLQADPEKCELNGFWFWILSPVSIEATDQNNNRAGVAEDGSIQNNIPGADYQIMGDHKFVFIPTGDGQTYTINLKGEDSGTFTFKNSQIANGQTAQTEIFSNLPVTPELSGQVVLSGSADQPTSLVLDTDGNGTTDQTLNPDAVLNQEQSDDLLPPVSALTITGEQGEPSFYRSNVLVNVSVNDDLSGVLAINYNIDNAGWQKVAPPEGGAAEITVADQGIHTITYFSTDRAGNNEPEKTTTFTIDTTPPEAVIEFDPTTKDLKFTSNETSTVQDNDNTILITDQAGNATEVTLKDRNRRIFKRAEIKSLKYNGVSADISRNLMGFLWIYDKKQNLKTLSQRAKSKNNYNILAVYDGKNTKVTGRDPTGKIKQTLAGLKLIKVSTNKGDLEWSY